MTATSSESNTDPASLNPGVLPDQPFLVGELIYLRPIESADAATAMLWRKEPYPVPTEVMQERIKEEEKEANYEKMRLLVCRRGEDVPVGLAEIQTYDERTATLTFHVAPVLGANAVSAVSAELLRLLVPWLIHEHDFMTVLIMMVAGDEVLERSARDLGLRFAFRLRNHVVREGRYRDLIAYEALHPRWVERLGEPPVPTEGPIVRPEEVRSPAPLHFETPTTEELRRNAMLVGKRLYLRPVEPADSQLAARYRRTEPDTFHDRGRWLFGGLAIDLWNRSKSEPKIPSWVRFSLVTRDTHEVIGANGLADIDWTTRTAESETEIFRPEYRGSGYGSEAKHLLLALGFEQMGLLAINSFAWTFNTRSCAALRRQGYRDAGGVTWSGLKDGDLAHDSVFDLLVDEWQAAREVGGKRAE